MGPYIALLILIGLTNNTSGVFMFSAHFKKVILSILSVFFLTSSISLASDGIAPISSASSDTIVVLRVFLNRNITNQAIDLRQLFNLQKNYAGYRVVAVAASALPNNPYGVTASLLVNGYAMASQYNPGRAIYLAPASVVRLNRVGTKFHLAIQGSTYIQEIRIQLSRY